MVRAVVADDEAGSRELLRLALEASGGVSVVGEAQDGAECLRLLFEQSPDVLFLDVEMPRLNGIEVAEEALRGSAPPLVVFVTGHDHFAVRAYALAALDYVVKDPDLAQFEVRVSDTVSRVRAALDRRGPCPVVPAPETREGAPRRPFRDRLPVKDYCEGTVRLLDPSDIVSIERRRRRAEVRIHDRRFPTYYTLDALFDRLAERGFARASRSALLNINHIAHMIPNGDGSYDAVLDDAERTVVPVSRANARALLGPLVS
jgi:two-component system, LytTR family, response regulator LytT